MGSWSWIDCEETDGSNRYCEAKEALSRPKHGEMQPGVLIAFAKGENVPKSMITKKEDLLPGYED